MKKMKWFALVSFSLTVASAQVDTTAKSFFPIDLRNRWVYEVYSPDLGRSYDVIEITRDSTDQNGSIFIELNNSGRFVYQVDSASNFFRLPFAQTAQRTLLYKLGANKGTVWATGGSPRYAWVEEEYQSTIFGKNTTVKVFRFSPQHRDSGGATFFLNEHHFAKDFGIVWEWAEPAQTKSLRGCVIRGDTTGQLTSVEKVIASRMPFPVELGQNYPNPFNPVTTIRYSVSTKSFVKIVLYDMLGREVRTLVEGIKNVGSHSVVLNAKELPSGVYFYRLTAGRNTGVGKMILLR